MKIHISLLLSACMIMPALSRADMVSMRDFNLLKRGMTEAEVLYRLGPSDHESIASDHYHEIIRKTWYYIPRQNGSNDWITEIEFDSHGVIQSLERYRARK